MAVSTTQLKELQMQIKKLRAENLRLKKQLGKNGGHTRKSVPPARRVTKISDTMKNPIAGQDAAQARDEFLIPPQITDPIERARVLAIVAERMRQNPLPPNAKRFTREELHERR